MRKKRVTHESDRPADNEEDMYADLRQKLGSKFIDPNFKLDSTIFNTISVVRNNIEEVALKVRAHAV